MGIAAAAAAAAAAVAAAAAAAAVAVAFAFAVAVAVADTFNLHGCKSCLQVSSSIAVCHRVTSVS